ncbi:sacsin N-terminal ATP-binding-like domain-containing protein [Sphingomonas oleivorans]|nr:ATP-binding protein [Sphingomonas oleivorans]
MADADAFAAERGSMDIRSSGLVHSAETDILRLQQILREGYASGFTIFKELLQNAEDAGASRMVVAGHAGFDDAVNPLLRAPGLIVANDGKVFARHMDAITRASGGSKADERSAVGRFGLGQKSVYHLCDAFIALGRVEDRDGRTQTLIMNPWDQVAEADAAHRDWPQLSHAEGKMLLDKASALGMKQGMALFLPLRTADLRPGPALCLSDMNWQPDSAIADILDGEELAATLCCLRNLESVEIIPIAGEGRRISMRNGARRLSGPGVESVAPNIGGQVVGAGFELTFSGRQQWKPDGQAAQLLKVDGWDKVFDIHGKLIPPKANPHGAVILCRSVAREGTGQLRLRNAVYLPLGAPLFAEPLERGSDNIDLLVHGYFFVSSDRRKLRDDDHIETRWNQALRREAALPLLLDAMADALPELPGDAERHALIRALQRTPWWNDHRAEACQGKALARSWPGDRAESWQVCSGASLRPVMRGDATSLARLKAAFPGLEDWCRENGIVLAFGTVLADADPRWPDAQLANLVRLAGPAAFQKGQVAETLAAVLEAAQPGEAARAALAETCRSAIALVDQSLASAEKLKPLVRRLPQDRILVLPPSVENRELLRALAAAGTSIPVKAAWAEQGGAMSRQLGLSETIELLAAAEPFLSARGAVAQEASALISHLLRNGPSLETLAADRRGSELQVIPARLMQDEADVRLSLGAIAGLKRRGLLFDAAPNRELLVLASAVAAPEVYQVRLKDGGLGDLASAKKTECLLAVLRQAESFGDPGKCGELAELLGADAPRDELRRLVARDPVLPSHVSLIELDELGGILDDLVQELLQDREDRLVASATTAELKKALRDRIGLRRIDLTELGGWLQDAQSAGAMRSMDDSKAMALLKSGIDDDVLKTLPLHRSIGHESLLPATDLFRGRASDIAPALLPFTRLVELWGDSPAAAVQNRLIARWGPEAAVRTALAAPNPERFTSEIATALGAIEHLPDDLIDALRQTAWIAAGGKAWTPTNVLDLPLDAEQALEDLILTQGGLLFASTLPGCLREEDVQRHLGRLQPDRSKSFLLAARLAADHGATGLCLDVVEHLDELARLASSNAELDAESWPLISAALRDGMADAVVAGMAEVLNAPPLAGIVAQMNAMAGLNGLGTNAEAARRLYRAAFGRNLAVLTNRSSYLPADLLVSTEAGGFGRADSVALSTAGIEPSALLAREYADKLDQLEEQAPSFLPMTKPAAADWLEGIERAFSPLSQYDVHDGILLALAMLGRDEQIQSLAVKWEGQRSFHRICDDLDRLADEQRGMAHANRERLAELRFAVELPDNGQVTVPSVAGSDCTVPLSGKDDALLLDCIPRGIERDQAGYRHVYDLVIGPVSPSDEAEARQLLDQFVRKLAIALMLGFERHKAALSELLASYFASDQRTLEDTCAELQEVLHDRLAGIKTGPVMRAAVNDYHRDAPRGRDKARSALWAAAQSDEGARELLEATRQKIDEMGYAPHRVLFELYQNAVDAQAQWHGNGRFRVEAIADGDQMITCLRVIHWGRPVNQPGSDPIKAEEEGHRRDLSNMLAINHSAKDGDTVTGRFGLGFKTVHMLADEVRLASGGIAIRILGGMIPADWEGGSRTIAPFHDRGRKATLIEIPVIPGRAGEALEAWEAFREAAPFLAALGQDASIEVARPEDEKVFRHEEHRLVDGVSWLAIDGTRRVLRFDLGNDFRLFLPFGCNGPHAFPSDVPQFWHLVPLVGERRRGVWLLEGRFPVDPGRTQLSGTADEKDSRFARLGLALGPRLMAFYDFCLADWASFARATGLDPEGRDDFWRKLVQLFAQDLASQGSEQSLHKSGQGLARLWAERPLVHLAFGGATRAADVKWRLSGALADRDAQVAISDLLAQEEFKKAVVTEETGQLLRSVGLPSGQRLDAVTLAEALAGAEGIDCALAESLACLCAEAVSLAMTGEEESEFRKFLRERHWLAEDGSWQSIRLLAFPQGNSDEQERAAFAPPSGRLASNYAGAAFDLAAFAREQAGHTPNVWEKWAESAGDSAARQQAFIRYLVGADDRTVAQLASAAKWLPAVDELANSPLLAGLQQDEKNRLLAKLGYSFSFASIPTDPTSSWQPDAEQALSGIAQWWHDNHGDLRDAYDRAVYPEDFSSTSLADGDKPAWFTMLSLATFQTLGRIKPAQSRQFVAKAIQDGWWHELATIDPCDEELKPFVERLRAWSDPDADESYLLWRRCLPDLCMVARHLESYQRLFMKLPAVVAQEGDISLRGHLRPAFSHVAARMGIEAAPLARSLGIGANWLVRELGRKGIYSQAQSEQIMPYGWSAAERVRRLAYTLGMGQFERGIDEGRALHGAVERFIGDAAHFDGDGDLPLHVITLAKHRDDLVSILNDADVEEWPDSNWDDAEDDDA